MKSWSISVIIQEVQIKIHTIISPPKCYKDYYKKPQETVSIGKDVKKKEPMYTFSKDVISTAIVETVCKFLKKLKIQSPYDPTMAVHTFKGNEISMSN
jgi:hypothetical protein